MKTRTPLKKDFFIGISGSVFDMDFLPAGQAAA
jgi:hypothetical protein